MSLKVLTVDDSKTIRMIVKKAFKPFDCEITEAENGVEGLSSAIREKPDLIVLDITMPVMDGLEMLEKLKSEPATANIPVIMLTAESGKDNVMKIVKLGVKDYIVKPFKGIQLIEKAKNIAKLEPKKEEEAGEMLNKYFSSDGDIQILNFPDIISRTVISEIDEHLKGKSKEMQQSGMNKVILDFSKVADINMTSIKMLISALQICQKASIHTRVIGTDALCNEIQGFKETSSLTVNQSVEEAKASF